MVTTSRRRPRLIALVALLSSSLAAGASPVQAADQPLSLNDAIGRAVSGNVDLRRERIAVDAADATLEVARGAFDFRLSSDLTFSRRTQPSLTTQDLQGGSTDTWLLDLGLARNLETGGTVSLGLSNTITETTERLTCGTVGGAVSECNVYGSQLGLNFTHPLLRGFGADIAQANLRRGRVQKDQALLNRQMRAANVIRDVINTYWGLAYATQDLAIRQSAVDLAREQLRVTQAQIDVGRLAPVDAAAVERAIGERMQEVLLSEQERLFRTLEIRRLFGQPTDPAMPLYLASDAPQASNRQVDVASEVARAVESNPQLRAITLGIRLTEIDMETARSTLRPQLDFIGRIGSTGRGRGRLDGLNQAVGFENVTWSAGLSLDVPLENRIAEGNDRLARLDNEGARLNAGDIELEVRQQALRLSAMITSSSKRVELAKATVGFANQNLEAEKARFSVGRSTNNDVLLRQQELKSAEIQVVRATVDLLVAETTLAALTGELLDRYRLVLKGM